MISEGLKIDKSKSLAYFMFRDGNILRFESNDEAKRDITENFERNAEVIMVPLKCKDGKETCCAIIEGIGLVSRGKREMGSEKLYSGESYVYCPRLKKEFRVVANVREYPPCF